MSNIISFFQKLIKGGGVGIRAGGWKIFQKLISGGGGRLFGTREYEVYYAFKGNRLDVLTSYADHEAE